MLRQGESGYAVNKACKARGWGVLGFLDICKLQDEMQNETRPPPSPVREKVPETARSGTLTPMALPPEVLESPTLAVPPPAVNGTQQHLQALLTWMGQAQIQEITLTRDGKLSVLARHQYDLGGQHG
jgi:hypothetical protein